MPTETVSRRGTGQEVLRRRAGVVSFSLVAVVDFLAVPDVEDFEDRVDDERVDEDRDEEDRVFEDSEDRGPRGLGGTVAALTRAGLVPIDAALQRGEQVDHLGVLALLLGLGRGEGLPALEFRLDQLLQLDAVVVLVVLRVEVVGEAVDQHRRHLELGRLDRRLVVERDEGRRPHLVGPQQRLHDQHVVLHAQRGEPGLLAQREVDDGDPVGRLQRLAQQHVRLGRLRRRFQVVALVVQQRIDLVGGNEAGHLDLAAGRRRHLREVLVGQDHRAAVVALVGLGDVRILDDLVVDLADPLVADAAAVGLVHLVEADVLLLGRRVQLDRDVDQAEGHRAFPD